MPKGVKCWLWYPSSDVVIIIIIIIIITCHAVVMLDVSTPSDTYRWRYMVIYITGYDLRASKVPSILVRKNWRLTEPGQCAGDRGGGMRFGESTSHGIWPPHRWFGGLKPPFPARSCFMSWLLHHLTLGRLHGDVGNGNLLIDRELNLSTSLKSICESKADMKLGRGSTLQYVDEHHIDE